MSKLFYKDKPIAGLDISNTGIKIMSVDSKKWLVNGYGSLDLEPQKVKESFEVQGNTYLTDSIKQMMAEKMIGDINTNRVAVSVPTARSFSRTFTLPVSTEKALHDAVVLEADQYIPIPSDNLYIDHQIIERNKKEITILMSAVTKVVIDNIVASIEAAGLEPVFIEPSISSVGRVLTATEEGTLPTVIIDIGPASTDIAILDKGTIRVTGGLAIGGNTFTLDIAKKLNVALENAHQLKVLNGLSAGPRQQKLGAALQPSLERILSEVKKVMRYYNERISDTRKLEQLLVVGSGSNLPGIGEYFTDKLVMPARVASPWQKLDFGKLQEPPKQFRSRYITVAGLASVSPGGIWK
ncbi:MAG: pilus assembly protein PilM [Candidatus Microsaccharimonas sp.]